MLFLTPSSSYESSIYFSVSPFYWSMLILNFIFGIMLILISTKKYLGFFLLYLTYTLSISTHIIHGYVWWNLSGDTGTHLGIVKEILWNGFCPKDIIYPASHVLLAEYSTILNVDIQILHLLLPVFFSLFFPLGIYLISKILLKNPIEKNIATIIGFSFLPGVCIAFFPNGLINCLFPLFLFIILKTMYNLKFAFKILTFIVFLLLTTFHPLIGMIMALIFVSMGISIVFFDKKYHKYFNNKYDLKFFSVFLVFTILGIIWMSWQMQFQEFNMILSNIVNTLNDEEYYRQAIFLNDISAANNYGYNILDYFIKTYGVYLISIIISIIALIIFFVKKQEKNNIFWIWICLSFLYTLAVLGLFFEFGFAPTRFLFYSMVLTIPLFGYVGGLVITNDLFFRGIKFKIFFIIIGLLVLMFVILNGLFTIYPSPYTLSSSYQSTNTEVAGMNWYFNNKDTGLEITGINLPTTRFYDFIFGVGDKRLVLGGVNSLYSPFHFGYDHHISLSNSYDTSLYLGITTRDLFKYVYVYPQMAKYRWNPRDFQRINRDSGIQKIYTNDGFELNFIGG